MIFLIEEITRSFLLSRRISLTSSLAYQQREEFFLWSAAVGLDIVFQLDEEIIERDAD